MIRINGATNSMTVDGIELAEGELQSLDGALGSQTIAGVKTFTNQVVINATENSATLGAEMLTNGTFTGNATGWTLGTNWAYSSNAVVCTINGSVEGTLSQNVNVVTASYYLLEWKQTNSIDTNAQITPSLGAVVGAKHSSGTTVQTYQSLFRATATGSVALTFTVNDITSTGTITIDDVSLKLLTPMVASAVLPSTTAGERKTEIRTQWNGVNSPNIGIGWRCLQSNTTGYANTANGVNALVSNTTGYNNTASGAGALFSNTTGYNNAASGAYVLYSNTTGNQNTATGVNALYSNTTFSNVSGFGYNAQVTASNQVQLGDAGTTTYVYGTVGNRSDIRDKADVRDTTLGMDFIKSLRPVDYKWDMREDYKPKAPNKDDFDTDELYKEAQDKWLEDCKLSNITHDGTHKRTRYHQGFIAQEVMALDSEFGGIQDHKVKGGDDVLSIGYDELIAPMVKAIQELEARVVELEARLMA